MAFNPTDEEVRAAEFRQKEALKARRRQQIEAGLHGDRTAAAAIFRGTQPLMRDHTPDIDVPEDESGAK